METIHFNRRCVILLNPNAANGRAGKVWTHLQRACQEVLGRFTLHRTQAPGEATELTRRALMDGYNLVVSVGGDGTNNEVVNGFFCPDGTPINPDAAFSTLPCGTGGDFRRSLGLGSIPKKATGELSGVVEHLGLCQAKACDLGRMTFINHNGVEEVRHFINITSFGIGGLVDEMVNNTTKILGGRLSFFIGSVRAGVVYRNQPMQVTVDGEPVYDGPAFSVAVANGKYFGGGMMMAPQAELDDGLLDIVIMGDLTFGEVVKIGPKIYKGGHLGSPKVISLQGKQVSVHTEGRVLIDMDGEQPGRLPARIEVNPGVLKILYPGRDSS